MWDTDVQKLMKKKVKDYIPVIAKNEVKYLPLLINKHDDMEDMNGDMFGFIVNTITTKQAKNGQTGHWTCVLISRDDKTIEYFDPLCETKTMPSHLLNICEIISKKMDPRHMFKLKVNRIKRQSDVSGTCGLHCVQFLTDRYNGEDFSEATGYDSYINNLSSKKMIDDSEDGEKEVSKKFKKFKNYI